MEVKVIVYIIGGILYFFYKRAQDIKKNAAAPALPQKTENAQPQPVPVKAPAYKSLEESRRELDKKRAAAEAQKKLSTPARQPLLTAKQADKPKDIFIREKKKATFGEGANDAPVYEEELPASAQIPRKDIRLENEGIYKTETMEEARALADVVEKSDYDFDAKQAFIGSIIFERKY